MLGPPARAAPGAGCSAPDSAGLHSRECCRPGDIKTGNRSCWFLVFFLFVCFWCQFRAPWPEVCPALPGRRIQPRCSEHRSAFRPGQPAIEGSVPGTLGRSRRRLPPRGASDAHQRGRGAAGAGDAAGRRSRGPGGELGANVTCAPSSATARRQARWGGGQAWEAAGERSGPLSPPLPGPAPAAPHHVGGAAAVPAAGLGFRNGKVHVPCARARPGSRLCGPQRLGTLASVAQRVPAASLAILGEGARARGWAGQGSVCRGAGRRSAGMLGNVVLAGRGRGLGLAATRSRGRGRAARREL